MEKKILMRNSYNDDLSIHSKEIELSLNSKETINPNLSKIILKERNNNNKSMKYYPISTSIYLAIEDNENINRKNVNLYQNYINENNIKKKNNESKKIKNSIRLQIKNETDDKENINLNINKNEDYINKEKKNNQINSNYHRIFNVNNHNLNKRINVNIKNNKKYKENNDKPHSYSFDNYLELNNIPIIETKIFDQSFVEGIKNINRKNNLIKAIEKYKKFKSLRLSIPLNNCLTMGFCSDDGRKKSYRKINTYDKIIEEENESGSEMTKRKEKEKANNKNIKNSINLNSIKKVKNDIKKNNVHFLFDYFNRKKKLNKSLTQKMSNKKSNTILVRRILREERYIIDENGKEQILEVNQSLFPKKLYTKKLKNIYSKSINDEEAEKIINKEKYKTNCRKIEIPNSKIDENKYENSFISHRKRRSLYENSPSKIKCVNGHIIDLLKQKQKPITIKKNKLEKKINFSNVNINININKSKCINNANSSLFNNKLYTIQNQTYYSKERKDNDEIKLSNEKKQRIYTIKKIYNNENKAPPKDFRQNCSFNDKAYTQGINSIKRISINEIIAKNKNIKNINNKNILSLRYHKSLDNALKLKTSNIASSSIENISQNNSNNYCDISSQAEYGKKLINKINPFIGNIYSCKNSFKQNNKYKC